MTTALQTYQLIQVETTCGSLLYELQIIWDEVGEFDGERDKMLLELEQTGLELNYDKQSLILKLRWLQWSEGLKQVLDHLSTLNSLCLVLGEDFKNTIKEVHPSLDESEGSKNISNETIHRLAY
ncbi:hypothetical protein FRX31_026636 [Thalictrum thalictroides]|uniref:Uncharacterized protein n=1 Tax=Thalictrum thalictroides TaxID=46969 RepID=A0A7J6VGF4_THATH|nr:hypothetical protein FRX31_026636 [Thalictrum thalictroides]